jgi:hypothetical protein
MPQLETVAGYPMLTLNWTREASEGDLHHFLAYRFTERSLTTSIAPVFQRLVAHLLLDELPDSALPEILDYLGTAWAFHQPISAEKKTEQPHMRKGKVTRRYERPTYFIDEE